MDENKNNCMITDTWIIRKKERKKQDTSSKC